MQLGELTAGKAAVQELIDIRQARRERPQPPIFAAKRRRLFVQTPRAKEILEDALRRRLAARVGDCRGNSGAHIDIRF